MKSQFSTIAFMVLAFTVFAETEPNNTAVQANNLESDGTVTGTLSGSDNEDWFVVNITKGCIYSVTINKTGSGNGTLYLLDGEKDGNPVLNSIALNYGDSPVSGWSASLALRAGKYYIRVIKYGNEVNYKISGTEVNPAFSEDAEPNDTVISAVNIEAGLTFSGTLHYYGAGKGKDNRDWFKVEIQTAGILKLKLFKKGAGNTTLYFRDENLVPGKSLSNFYLHYGDSPAEGYNWDFAVLAGTYWILMEGGDGVVDYRIETVLEQPVFTNDIEPNDTVTAATDIQVGETINGTLHYYAPGKGKDERDWFKLEIDSAGIIKMILNKKGTGHTTMYFRDDKTKSGKAISNFYLPSGESPSGGYSWNFAALAGTYWILMEGGDGVVDYQLVTSIDKPEWREDTENNDSLSLAAEFPVNDSISGVLYYNKPGFGFDQTDWYKIVTPDYGQLSFQISKKGIYGAVKIADKEKDLLFHAFTYGDANYVISKLLPAGTYYLVFQHSSNWLQYKASMKFTPKPATDFSFLNDGFSIAFDNNTGFGETFTWNFDDGTKSTQLNPFHSYTNPGEYDVCLVATNVAGKDTACKRVTIPGVERYFPQEGGNTGIVTVEIHGGGLDTNFVATLKNGNEIIAVSEYTYIVGKGTIKLAFNLLEKPTGIYDFVLEKAGGPSYIFSGGFKIVAGTRSDPWVSISGRNRILFNTLTTYTVNYGNYGNVDAIMTPVWLVFSNKPGLDIKLTGLEFFDPITEESVSEEDMVFEEEMIFGVPKVVKVYSVIIPNIPAKSTNSFSFSLKSGEDLEVMVWNGKPLFQSPFNPQIFICFAEYLENYQKTVIETLKADKVECFTGLFEHYFNFAKSFFERKSGKYFNNLSKKRIKVLSFKVAVKLALQDCEVDLKDEETIRSLLFALWYNNNIIKINQTKKSGEIDTSQVSCYTEFAPNHLQTTTIRTVSSLDPNEKTGLCGFGPDNFVAGTKDISYTVYFENLSTATAPAHVITITDQLDKSNFDLSSFNFGNIRVGDSLLYFQPGQKSVVVNKLFANRNTVARITGELDTITGKVEWKFRSLDPVTLADIEDPDIGLLPPNLVSPEGEGSVSFQVKMKNNPEHGQSITNEASIVFDSNPAIQTNLHKITFDLKTPESKVLPLATTSSAHEFEVKWSGSDQGSGIQVYNIFVSANNEPYMLWIGGTTQTSATFSSDSDKQYKFISLTADNVGNREVVPEMPDAVINVATGTTLPETGFSLVSIFPVPAKKEIFCRISENGIYQFKIFGIDGKIIGNNELTGNEIHRIDISGYPKGLYFWDIQDADQKCHKTGKFIVAE